MTEGTEQPLSGRPPGAATARGSAGATVDVIIPVYRGLEETRACIESVLAAPCRTARQIIVIDDASP